MTLSDTKFDDVFSMALFYYNKGKIGKALELLEASLLHAASEEEFAKGFEYLARIYTDRNNSEKAREYYLKSLEKYEMNGDIGGKIRILNKLALLHATKKDYEESIRYYEALYGILKQNRDIGKEIAVLKNLGKLYSAVGEFVKSLRCHQKALELARESEDKLEEARKLKHIGFTYENSGDFDKAEEYYRMALEVYREVGDEAGISRIEELLDNLEDLRRNYIEEGDFITDYHLRWNREDFF